jgi:hypothetical protein
VFGRLEVRRGAMGLMRRVLLGIVVGAGIAAAAPATWATEVPDERAQVAAVARDYLESWYTADAERMAEVLHADLVKRYVDALPTGKQVVQSLTRELMVEMTRGGGGSKVPPESRKIAADVLEVSGDIAVARASSSEYVEYLSMAKCNGRWQIINILWRFRASGAVSR